MQKCKNAKITACNSQYTSHITFLHFCILAHPTTLLLSIGNNKI